MVSLGLLGDVLGSFSELGQHHYYGYFALLGFFYFFAGCCDRHFGTGCARLAKMFSREM